MIFGFAEIFFAPSRKDRKNPYLRIDFEAYKTGTAAV